MLWRPVAPPAGILYLYLCLLFLKLKKKKKLKQFVFCVISLSLCLAGKQGLGSLFHSLYPSLHRDAFIYRNSRG